MLLWLQVMFYCHFPDMLLTDRCTVVKWLYRAPIDWLEERTTGMADCVLVNSQFTGRCCYLLCWIRFFRCSWMT